MEVQSVTNYARFLLSFSMDTANPVDFQLTSISNSQAVFSILIIFFTFILILSIIIDVYNARQYQSSSSHNIQSKHHSDASYIIAAAFDERGIGFQLLNSPVTRPTDDLSLESSGIKENIQPNPIDNSKFKLEVQAMLDSPKNPRRKHVESKKSPANSPLQARRKGGNESPPSPRKRGYSRGLTDILDELGVVDVSEHGTSSNGDDLMDRTPDSSDYDSYGDDEDEDESTLSSIVRRKHTPPVMKLYNKLFKAKPTTAQAPTPEQPSYSSPSRRDKDREYQNHVHELKSCATLAQLKNMNENVPKSSLLREASSDGHSGGGQQSHHRAPKSLASYFSWYFDFLKSLQRHHSILKIFFYPSYQYSIGVRILEWGGEVYLMIVCCTLILVFFHSKWFFEQSCDEFTSQGMEACESESLNTHDTTIFRFLAGYILHKTSSTQACRWDNDNAQCYPRTPIPNYVHDSRSFASFIFLAIIGLSLSLPPRLLLHQLFDKIHYALPHFIQSKNWAWLCSKCYPLDIHNDVKSNDEDDVELGSKKGFTLATPVELSVNKYWYFDFITCPEEVRVLYANVRDFLVDIRDRTPIPWKHGTELVDGFYSHSHFEKVESILSNMKVYPDGTPVRLSILEFLRYITGRRRTESILTKCRQDADAIIQQLCESVGKLKTDFPQDLSERVDYSQKALLASLDDHIAEENRLFYAQVVLLQHFVLEQFHVTEQFILSRNFFRYDLSLPAFINTWKWGFTWFSILCLYGGSMYLTFIALKHNEEMGSILAFPIIKLVTLTVFCLILEYILIEPLQIFINDTIIKTSLVPQLQQVYHVLVTVYTTFEGLEKHRSLIFKNLHDYIKIVQHFSPACRAARFAMLHNSIVSKLLENMDDVDIAACRNVQFLSRPWFAVACLSVLKGITWITPASITPVMLLLWSKFLCTVVMTFLVYLFFILIVYYRLALGLGIAGLLLVAITYLVYNYSTQFRSSPSSFSGEERHLSNLFITNYNQVKQQERKQTWFQHAHYEFNNIVGRCFYREITIPSRVAVSQESMELTWKNMNMPSHLSSVSVASNTSRLLAHYKSAYALTSKLNRKTSSSMYGNRNADMKQEYKCTRIMANIPHDIIEMGIYEEYQIKRSLAESSGNGKEPRLYSLRDVFKFARQLEFHVTYELDVATARAGRLFKEHAKMNEDCLYETIGGFNPPSPTKQIRAIKSVKSIYKLSPSYAGSSDASIPLHLLDEETSLLVLKKVVASYQPDGVPFSSRELNFLFDAFDIFLNRCVDQFMVFEEDERLFDKMNRLVCVEVVEFTNWFYEAMEYLLSQRGNRRNKQQYNANNLIFGMTLSFDRQHSTGEKKPSTSTLSSLAPANEAVKKSLQHSPSSFFAVPSSYANDSDSLDYSY